MAGDAQSTGGAEAQPQGNAPPPQPQAVGPVEPPSVVSPPKVVAHSADSIIETTTIRVESDPGSRTEKE
jgi:hypothetical protein